MRAIFWTSILLGLAACGSNRVLVKDCQPLQGMGDTQNCELIRKL